MTHSSVASESQWLLGNAFCGMVLMMSGHLVLLWNPHWLAQDKFSQSTKNMTPTSNCERHSVVLELVVNKNPVLNVFAYTEIVKSCFLRKLHFTPITSFHNLKKQHCARLEL